MLQHVAKWALLATLWRRASPYIVGSVIAVGMVFAVTVIHAEFLDYVRLRNELQGGEQGSVGNYLSLSFIIKWLCYGAIALCYSIYWVRRTRAISARKHGGFSRRPSAIKRSATDRSHLLAESNPPSVHDDLTEDDDAAFDFLRDKRRLRGRGQQLLDRDRERS